MELFDASDELGFIFLPNGEFYTTNKAFNKIFSVEDETLQSKAFTDLFSNIDNRVKLPELKAFHNGRYILHILEQDLEVDIQI